MAVVEPDHVPTNHSPEADPYVIVHGSAHPQLAKDIASRLQANLIDGVPVIFANGESLAKLDRTVRGSDAFIVQPTCGNVDQSTLQVAFMGDALRRSSARSITLVAPFIGYSRQDRQTGRESVSIAVVLDLFQANHITRLVTVDPHSDQALGKFQDATDVLHASPYLVPRVKSWDLEDIVVVSPDQGGAPRSAAFASRLKKAGVNVVGNANCIKDHEPGTNKTRIVDMAGDVEGKNALVFDDMVDTVGTHGGAARFCMSRGAKSVSLVAVHPVLSSTRLPNGDTITALQRLKEAPIARVLTTDTIPATDNVRKDSLVEIVSIAPMLAEAIKRIHSYHSIRDMYD